MPKKTGEVIQTTAYLTRTVKETKQLISRRRRWLNDALQGNNDWTCDGIVRRFAGGRTCICGHTVKNALVLKKKGMPDVFVGQTCALGALAFLTGGDHAFDMAPAAELPLQELAA